MIRFLINSRIGLGRDHRALLKHTNMKVYMTLVMWVVVLTRLTVQQPQNFDSVNVMPENRTPDLLRRGRKLVWYAVRYSGRHSHKRNVCENENKYKVGKIFKYFYHSSGVSSPFHTKTWFRSCLFLETDPAMGINSEASDSYLPCWVPLAITVLIARKIP